MIITLCGSARFEPWYHAWNEALSLSGHCVFGLASYPSQHDGIKSWYTDEMKRTLDAVHQRKIHASDAILVLNVFAYIGESTLAEIKCARDLQRPVHFLESWGKGFGIGDRHRAPVRSAARGFGVYGKGSLIDTFESYDNRSVWDLLGPAGAERTAIVRSLKRRLAEVSGNLDESV